MATRVPIRYGGTGANTAAGVRAALGVLSTSGGSFTGNLNVNSVIMANSRGVFGNSFQDHANSVGIDTSTVIVGAYANNDGPAEVMVVNKSNGSVAYAEFIALNDTANQEQGWISIGVNSSDYNDPEYTLTGPDDGYLLFEAPLGTAANGDLIIGTGSYGDKNRIVLAAGGFEPSDAQLLIAPANLKSASITQSRLNSNIAILTTSATHNFVANDVVIISSVGAPYDGTRTILAVTANTFNVSITSANVALANVSPAGEALEYLPFNKGTVELTAQLFVGENSKSTIETADITLAEGHAIPLGVVVNNDGPGQTVMFNKSNGALAFSEFIAHNDQGNVHQGWISMGINSSGYDDPEFPITKEDDGYLLFEAPAGTTGGGDLIIGTGTNGQTNRLIFAAEGFDEANAQMIITPDESVRISINTDSSSANTGALQVVGGVGVQGSMYVQGNQTIQGDLIVNGSQIIQSIENLAAAGPISLVSEGNIANTWDQGIVGTYAVAVGSVARNVEFKEIANNTGIISTSNNHSFIVEDIVTIAGVDVTFNGTHRITAVTANTLSFYLLAGNVSKTSSSGTATVDKTTKYTGLVKKASDGTWRIFSNLGSRPGFNTDLSAANLAYDSIIAGSGDFRGTLKLGSPNTATISYTDNNARALTIPALSGDRTFAFIDQAQTFTAAQGFNSTVTATKFIPTGGDATGNGLYLPSTNRVSISADGVERVAISASETVVNDGSADYDFRVESDGVAHMLFVDGGTNTVGIGTNAPSANLHVVGTGYISGDVGIGVSSPLFTKFTVAKSDSATSIETNYNPGIFNLQNSSATNGNLSLIGFQDASAFISLAAIGAINVTHSGSPNSVVGALAFYTKASGGGYVSERMRIDSSGRILIGTTQVSVSSSEKFEVYNGMTLLDFNSDSVASLYVKNRSTTAATIQPYVYFVDSSGNRGGIGIKTTDSSFHQYGQGGFSFYTGSSGFSGERLTITSGGNVGIGATSPSGRLTIQRSATGANTDITFKNEVGDDRSRIRFGGTVEELAFWTRAGGDITERMRIAAEGNVGIGTTTPDFLLDVVGSSGNTWARVISGSGGTSGGLIVGNNDGGTENYGRLFWNNASNDLVLSQEYTSGNLIFRTNATNRMRITNDGNVYTEAGSAISYGSGETYQIWCDEPEYSIVHSDANWKDMKTFVCSKSGNLKFKFSAYISSGTYYWAWRIRRNGTTTVASGGFMTGLDAGESASVHAYRRFVASVGPIAAGDSLVLQMISASGSEVPVTGVGQTLFVKEFRAYSTVPNVEHGGSTNIWGTRVGIGTISPNIKLHVVSGAGANYSSTVNKSNNMFGISVTSTTNADTMQGIWFASGTDGAGTHWSGIAGARENSAAHWGTKLVFYTHDQNTNNLDQANERLAITGFGGFHRRYKTEHFILREFAELGSAFDNPTQNIITLPTTGATNSVLMVKVIVRQVAYATSVANEHIGYARAMWNGSSWDLNVSTMSVVGNANLANVGTLSWSTRTLVYTSNRASNYDNYLVSYEVFNPAQVNLTYVF